MAQQAAKSRHTDCKESKLETQRWQIVSTNFKDAPADSPANKDPYRLWPVLVPENSALRSLPARAGPASGNYAPGAEYPSSAKMHQAARIIQNWATGVQPR